MDSDFQHVGTVIKASELNVDLSDMSVIILDNIQMNGVSNVLSLSGGHSTNIAPGTIDFYLFGNMKDGGPSTFESLGLAMPRPDDSLAPLSTPIYARRSYYVKSRHQ
jgi:hypothetical protein